MQLGSTLDLAIGLSFMFFLLSLIATSIQEFLAGIFTWRGTYLSKGLDIILANDPAAKFQFNGVIDWLRAHFTRKPGLTAAAALTQGTRQNPPAGDQARQQAALQQVLNVQNHPLLRSNPATLPSYVPAHSFSSAMLDVLRDGSQSPLFSQIETTIDALPPGDLKTLLTLYAQDAGGDIDKFRAAIETWFDDAMDRVSGLYKRYAQYVLFTLGLILAVGLNVNTVHVAITLANNPALRTNLAEQGTTAASDAPAAATPSASAASASASASDQIQNIENQVNTFNTLGFPVGWSDWKTQAIAQREIGAGACPASAKSPCPPSPSFLKYGFYSLLGWFITAIAISLGAPFWFDLLQNIVNIRNAGTKPARSDATS